MLLDLYSCHVEGRLISVTSACIASGAAATTALRWLGRLEAEGLVIRRRDEGDGRRTFLEMTDGAVVAVGRWLQTAFGD